MGNLREAKHPERRRRRKEEEKAKGKEKYR
jgi:hypothetical protein